MFIPCVVDYSGGSRDVELQSINERVPPELLSSCDLVFGNAPISGMVVRSD